MFQAYQMFNKQGIKIAVIGLTTEDGQNRNPELLVVLISVIQRLKRKSLLQRSKTEKPDLIFAVTHMGHYENGNRGINAPGSGSGSLSR